MKRFVTVNASFQADGSMCVKFTCVILGKIRELYFEEQRWYILK